MRFASFGVLALSALGSVVAARQRRGVNTINLARATTGLQDVVRMITLGVSDQGRLINLILVGDLG
jgi:hypothetical protein